MKKRALAAARREFPSIVKNRQHVVTSTKGNYGFKWADLVNISEGVDPVLERHGLSYSWWSEMANGAAQLIVHCVLRHENGQEMESQFPVPTSSSSGMSDQQRFASAQMFGRRKSLEQVLGLVIDEMPGEAAAEFDPTAVTEEQAMTLTALAEEASREAQGGPVVEEEDDGAASARTSREGVWKVRRDYNDNDIRGNSSSDKREGR